MTPVPPPLVIRPGAASGSARDPVAVLVHLSGAARGTSIRLTGVRLNLGAGPRADVRVSPETMVAEHHATLSRSGSSWLLTVEPELELWVNGDPVRERLLESGDVLEIGRDGPILRFRLYPAGTRLSKSVSEAFLDGIDGARFGAGSPPERVMRGITGAVRALATETSIWFRIAAVAVAVLLITAVLALIVRSRGLERRLEREELRVEGLAALIEESRRALSPEELAAVRGGVETALERVEALEAHRDAPARVVAAASSAVILLQGTYGFVDPESGEPLRFLGLDEKGQPLTGARGEPLVGLGGDGPPVEAQFLGTAFVAGPQGLLLTNRHVALPWEYEGAARLLMAQGLEPAVGRFMGFQPGRPEPVDAVFVGAAENADLAVLWAPELAAVAEPLELRTEPPDRGDEVIVLGYPAGIRALLARSDAAFVSELMNDPAVDFWEVTRRLAAAGEIGPLASRGIVAQVSAAAVVYDAETTRGGSGGPVLDLDGKVVAITSAIVGDFGGSNLGVPAARGQELLDTAGLAELAIPAP